MADCRLRREYHAISDAAVAGDSRLPGENHIVADHRGAGQAGLRADQGIFADARTMSYLDKVVDLAAVADFRGANRCAVDAGVGLNVNAVAEPHRARLRNLLPLAQIILRESEAVCADDRTIFKGDMVAEHATLAHDRMSVSKEVAAALHARIQHHVRQQRGVRPEPDIRADNDVGADVRSFADLRCRIDDCRGVNAGAGMLGGW